MGAAASGLEESENMAESAVNRCGDWIGELPKEGAAAPSASEQHSKRLQFDKDGRVALIREDGLATDGHGLFRSKWEGTWKVQGSEQLVLQLTSLTQDHEQSKEAISKSEEQTVNLSATVHVLIEGERPCLTLHFQEQQWRFLPDPDGHILRLMQAEHEQRLLQYLSAHPPVVDN